MEKIQMEKQGMQMTQENIEISHRRLYCLIFFVGTFFLTSCEEVSPYSYNCKNFNKQYLAKLSENEDIDSARELASLYVECNPESESKYKELALQWSEKVMSYKEANENQKFNGVKNSMGSDSKNSMWSDSIDFKLKPNTSKYK